MKIQTNYRAACLRTGRGFTLLEIIIVLGIISLLVGTLMIKVKGGTEKAKVVRVRADLGKIEAALQLYQLSGMRFPSTEQGLKALVVRPNTPPVPKRWEKSLDAVPTDPYGSEYYYRYPGKVNEDSFDVYSAGKDGLPDTEDDIGNWPDA